MLWLWLASIGSALAACACNSEGPKPAAAPDGKVDQVASAPAESCGNVRLTSYTASKGGWCEFDRTAPMLPASVRAGLTLAIAEPWNGSSYGGVSGEACGECWQITSLDATVIAMVHDLCPIEGNPICNGSHFHFDVSTETAAALKLAGLDAASTRRVPCPVTGNAHLQLIDRNEWGYVRFQVVNHRIPIRNIEFRAANGADFFPAERSGGAWAVADNGAMFAREGPGGVFRITSTQGQVLELPNVLAYTVPKGSFFDLGAQFTDQTSSNNDTACAFLPPADVYVDGYGGIESVRWMMNPWAQAEPAEVSTGCVSGTCLRIAGMGSGAGFHIYYRQSFVPTRFKSLHLATRTVTGSGVVNVTLTGEGTKCKESPVSVGEAWAETSLDLAAICADSGAINSVTVYGSSALTLMLDDLRFVP